MPSVFFYLFDFVDSRYAGLYPLFFRMSGREAELTDPQHRIFLMEAWRALEDACLAPERQMY